MNRRQAALLFVAALVGAAILHLHERAERAQARATTYGEQASRFAVVITHCANGGTIDIAGHRVQCKPR